MNEEEKKAIEELEEFIKGPCETCKYCKGAYKLNRKNVIQLLNLTKKLQKENEYYKLLLDTNKNFTIDKKNRNYKWNVIEIQKVKDKIEKIKQEKKKYGNCLIEMYEDELVNRDIKILQELIEESED